MENNQLNSTQKKNEINHFTPYLIIFGIFLVFTAFLWFIFKKYNSSTGISSGEAFDAISIVITVAAILIGIFNILAYMNFGEFKKEIQEIEIKRDLTLAKEISNLKNDIEYFKIKIKDEIKYEVIDDVNNSLINVKIQFNLIQKKIILNKIEYIFNNLSSGREIMFSYLLELNNLLEYFLDDWNIFIENEKFYELKGKINVQINEINPYINFIIDNHARIHTMMQIRNKEEYKILSSNLIENIYKINNLKDDKNKFDKIQNTSIVINILSQIENENIDFFNIKK